MNGRMPTHPAVLFYASSTTTTRRRGRNGARSSITATTIPAIGTTPHSPLNQLCTAEYQSKLVGRKMNPSAGMSHVVKIPWNQFVNSHNATIVNRGTSTPNNRINKGIR
jgi:hypothetical protein